jgi:hypothetical protein
LFRDFIGKELFLKSEKYYFTSIAIVLAVVITCQAEFQVNTNTSNRQEHPAIAMDGAGNFVVVWRSEHTGSRGTYGQRFSADGTPLGSEFQTNTTSVGGRVSTGPAVAMDSVGNFVVAWTGYRNGEENIIARRYNSSGAPITGEFVVNTYKHATFENSHIGPNVSMNANGSFVIVWEAWHGNDDHSGNWGVYARAYNSSGHPQGDEFQVNQIAGGENPDVVMDGSGDFVVTWLLHSSGQYVRFRRYNSDGTPKGEAVQITDSLSSSVRPSIAMDSSGNFVITWQDHPITYKENDVYFQRFEPDGNPIGVPLMVNTYFQSGQGASRVSMNDQGQFIVVWYSRNDHDGDLEGVFGQRYDTDGDPFGEEFQINSYVIGCQWFPEVAIKNTGEFVTVWQSDGQDGDGFGIFGRIGAKICRADFNNDLLVNLRDLAILASAWQSEYGDTNWNQECNISEPNDIIDYNDLTVFTEYWLYGSER